MSEGVEVRVVGFEQLVEGSTRLVGKIEDAAGRALERETAAQAASNVRARVPHLTGALAGSVVTGSDQRGSAWVGIGAGVPYAGWIEFGGTRGRPYIGEGRYLFPTALAAEPQAVVVASTAAEREIGAFAWPRPSV